MGELFWSIRQVIRKLCNLLLVVALFGCKQGPFSPAYPFQLRFRLILSKRVYP